MSDSYVVVGNFATEYDAAARQYFSTHNPTNLRQFFNQVKPLSDALGLEVIDFFNDAVVLTGDDNDKECLKKFLGEDFSVANTDRYGFEQARDCYLGTYQLSFPGYVAYKAPEAESEIEVLLAPSNKNLMRYDA